MKEIAFGGYGDLRRRSAIGGSTFGEAGVIEAVSGVALRPVRRYFDGVHRRFIVRQVLFNGSDTAEVKTNVLLAVSQVQQICEDLDVRYVLEGSVRKAGNRVRITAKLADGVTGGQVWADRYDRDLTAIYEIQDDIS